MPGAMEPVQIINYLQSLIELVFAQGEVLFIVAAHLALELLGEVSRPGLVEPLAIQVILVLFAVLLASLARQLSFHYLFGAH